MSNEDDLNYFRESMADVKPLNSDRLETQSPKPRPVPYQTQKDEALVLEELARSNTDEAYTGETLGYCREGVQKTVFKRLRKGYYRVSAELDLHGMRVAEAGPALARFLLHAREDDARCVRIIHGKGRRSSNEGPVLKPLVSNWLSKRDEVLAFCSARGIDGGTGALYVLLRKKS